MSGYNWKCDGCGDAYSARPGFEFYTCKHCRMDWCHNDFRFVETKIRKQTEKLIKLGESIVGDPTESNDTEVKSSLNSGGDYSSSH